MKIRRQDVIKGYIAFCICMDADVFVRVFGSLTPSAGGRTGIVNNPVMFSFTATLILGTLALSLPMWRRTLTVLLNQPWLTALFVWSILTIFWSPTPAMIVRAGLTIWAFMLCGVISALYLTMDDVNDVIRRVVTFLALLSFAFEEFLPVHETTAPGWTGVYGEKNHLGIGMGVGCIAQFASTRPWTLTRVLQTTLFATLLVLSQSTTSMAFVVVAGGFYLVVRFPKHIRPFASSLLAGSAVLAFALVPNLVGKVFDATGKNTNFTGRDVIWHLTLEQWEKRPLVGFGFESFWESQDDAVQQELNWNPRQAHNGFLEVGVTTGVIGVILLLGSLVGGLQLIARAKRSGCQAATLWLALSWLCLMIDSITEADFMVPGPLWFTYCMVYFLTYAEVRRANRFVVPGLHGSLNRYFVARAPVFKARGIAHTNGTAIHS